MSFHIDPRLRDASAASADASQPQQHLATAILPPQTGSNSTASISASPGTQHQQQLHYHPIHSQSPSQNGSPDLYLPHSPHSHHGVQEPDGNFEGIDDGANDPKRPRACEACRGLKVRCEPDPHNPEGDCKRCAKAKRRCVVTVPSRKRQKKTDSRVAELEKKIDALQATLQATNPVVAGSVHTENNRENKGLNTQGRHNPYQQVTNGAYGSPYLPRSEPPTDWSSYSNRTEIETKHSTPPTVLAGQKRKHAETRDLSTSSEYEIPDGASQRNPTYLDKPESSFLPPAFISPKPPQRHHYRDVIDRDIVTAEMAALMFNCYLEKMMPHMPIVVFSHGTTAADVRKNKPILFLAILSASSGMNYPHLQRPLTTEIMKIYADRIICDGDKSLEIIQALHVSTIWYWPPDHFEELKFYQLIHNAAVMALDIGMGRKLKSGKTDKAGLWRDHPWRRTPYPDPESLDSRRAWLGCYFLCCNTAMGLRRPNLITWSSFIADCVEVLETNSEAAPTDKILCQWVRSQHIAEEVSAQFSMDDPSASISIADTKVQYALKGFERDLEKWSSNVPLEAQSRALKMTEHVVNLYMHEVAMHVDHNVDEFKPPFTEETLRGEGGSAPEILGPAQIGALSTCLTSIDGIFEAFLGFDVDTVRCLPVACFVRVAYAVVVLIKMYFAASTPNSELGKVIDKDNMKVEQYLDGLVETFKAASSEDKSRPAQKFGMVLVMLKTWFHRQRESKSGSSDEFKKVATAHPETPAGAPNEPNQNSNDSMEVSKSNYSPANTPLQLLSELATGNSRGQQNPENRYPVTSENWPQQSAQAFQSFGSMGQAPVQQPWISGNIDPSLGMDLEYSMGDGLEQAMGLTMGGFEGYGLSFTDDTFFGGIMDSVGSAAEFSGY